MTRLTILIGSLAIGMFCLSQTTQGAMTAYEGFEYSSQSPDGLAGNAGGIGFSSTPWQLGGFNAFDCTNYQIASGSLQYAAMPSSGNRVSTAATEAIAGIARYFETPINASQTITQYYSFMIRPEGILNGGAWNGFFGLYLDGVGDSDLFIGKSGGMVMDKYVMEDRGGANQVATNQNVVLQQTALLVLKAEYKPGQDKFTLYTNPSGTEPSSGTVKYMDLGTVSDLVIYSTGAFSLDELRIGNAFTDVVPVPEPAAIAILGTSCLGLLIFFRRNNRR